MSTALETLGSVLEERGWVRSTGGDYHVPGLQHVGWTHRTLPLRLWSVADRSGVRDHVLACSAPKGAGWVWRVELAGADERFAATAAGAAHAATENRRGPDPGSVFSALAATGWEITCGSDPEEASYGASGPDGAALVRLPDSPVDPGMWVITTPSGAQFTASSGTPWTVVMVMAVMC